MIPLIGKPAIVDAREMSVQDAVNPTPSMRSTVMGWFRAISLVIVRQVTEDHETREISVPFNGQGVIMPLSAKALELKPEGTRTWDWRDVYVSPDLALTTKDAVIIPRAGVQTRFVVMRAWDYSAQGYMRYEIVNAYA